MVRRGNRRNRCSLPRLWLVQGPAKFPSGYLRTPEGVRPARLGTDVVLRGRHRSGQATFTMRQTSALHAIGEISDDPREDLKHIIQEVEPPVSTGHRVQRPAGPAMASYSTTYCVPCPLRGDPVYRDDSSLHSQQVRQSRDDRGCVDFSSTPPEPALGPALWPRHSSSAEPERRHRDYLTQPCP